MSGSVVDLDPIIQAYDQRIVPIALGRVLLISGAGISSLIPILDAIRGKTPSLKIMSFGIGMLMCGFLLVSLFLFPRTRWIARIAGMFAGTIAFFGFAVAIWSLSPAFRFVTPEAVDKPLMDAIHVLRMHYDDANWMIARLIGAGFAVLMAIGIGKAAWHYCRLRDGQIAALTERASSFRAFLLRLMLDFPSSLLRYGRGTILGLGLALAATVAFTIAASNIAGAMPSQYFKALGDTTDCVDGRRPLEQCVIEAGNRNAIGIPILVISPLLWALLGMWLLFNSRKRLITRAAENLEKDTGPCILFLRAFRRHADSGTSASRTSDKDEDYDQVKMPRPRFSLITWVLGGYPRAQSMDRLLVEQFVDEGPPIAFGKQEEAVTFQLFGAVRKHCKEEDWHDAVKHDLKRSKLIVVVFDESICTSCEGEETDRKPGLRWELEYLGTDENGVRARTLFMLHPECPTGRTKEIWKAAGDLARFAVPDTDKPLFGLMVNTEGSTDAFLASQSNATAATIALRMAFSRPNIAS
jgi:hypothetical protein